MILNENLNKVPLNPKKLFLIDGFGAILSAFLLGVVLVKFESVFGLPRKTLYFLAFLPCVFAAYDFFCYLRIKKNIGQLLKIIAFVNLAYCCISMGLAFYHHQRLTHWGWIYILLEIAVVLILVYLELKIAAKSLNSFVPYSSPNNSNTTG